MNLFLSQEGYFKKITPQSLRMASDQKYKEGDGPWLSWEGANRDELLVFTDKQQCYKTRMSDFDDAKASVLGDYLPTKLAMDPEERVVWACIPGDYSGQLIFVFANGKIARVELSAYQTQTRRKKLTGAYSDKAPLAAAFLVREDFELADHPHHPGGQRDDPEAQAGGGEGTAPGGDGHCQRRPVPGPEPAGGRRPPEGGGPG